MKKNIFNIATSLAFLLMMSGCSEIESFFGEQTGNRISLSVQMPSEETTRVSLSEAQNTKDLLARWQEDDEVQVFITQEKNIYPIGNIKVSDISGDGKSASIKMDLPGMINQTKPYTIYCFTGIEGIVNQTDDGTWVPYCDMEITRSLKSQLRAQMFAQVDVPDVSGGTSMPSTNMSFIARFKHIGTYEVLHLKNTSTQKASMAHCGFNVEKPWYRGWAGVRLVDDYDHTKLWGEWDGDDFSPTIDIPSGVECVFLSAYMPSGFKMQDAQLVLKHNGVTIYSTNKKSSEVKIQRGHAYHMYATWDGTELKFTNGDIEDENLELSETSVSLQKGDRATVMITSGSGQYTLTNSNSQIVSAAIANTNQIVMVGQKAGTATITITDTNTKQTATIAVTVTDEVSVEGQKFTVNGVSFNMIGVEGGTFWMGASDDDTNAYSDERPTHQVTLSSFAIGQTEVTQELWEAVMGSNPSYFKGSKLPVENVSWNDCQTFIEKLNQLTGKKFRLPTEAEWEYAARGGTNTSLYNGENIIINGLNNSPNLDKLAWYGGNCGQNYTASAGCDVSNGYNISGWSEKQYNDSKGGTHPVGLKQPNAYGLYDMLGNVWEWCQDWYDGGYYSNSPQTNPTGPSSGSYRVERGGSWYYSARYCRVSNRSTTTPSSGTTASGCAWPYSSPLKGKKVLRAL